MPLDGVEVLGKRLEVPRDPGLERRDVHVLDVLERVGEQVAVLGAARCDAEAAVARDHRGDAVPRRRRERRIPEDLRVVVRVDVDEPRGHDVAARVELLAAVEAHTDLADHAVGDADVVDDAGSPVPSSTVPPRMTMSAAMDHLTMSRRDVLDGADT